MSLLLDVYPETYPALVKHLNTIEAMHLSDARLLPGLIGQLALEMVVEKYLRALPLVGVDTKFLENYQSLITDVLDILHGNAVLNKGNGLAAMPIPKDG